MSQQKNESNIPDSSTIGGKLAIVLSSFADSLSDDAAVELGRGLAAIVRRLSLAAQGTFTPESGMFDTYMLAAFQNREPESIRRWCEDRDVTVRKTGKPNSYRASEIIEAARGPRDGEETAGKR